MKNRTLRSAPRGVGAGHTVRRAGAATAAVLAFAVPAPAFAQDPAPVATDPGTSSTGWSSSSSPSTASTPSGSYSSSTSAASTTPSTSSSTATSTSPAASARERKLRARLRAEQRTNKKLRRERRAAAAEARAAKRAAKSEEAAPADEAEAAAQRHGEDKPLELGPAAGEAGADSADGGGGGGSIVRTFFGLLVVVALIYAVHWALKRTQGGAAGRGTRGAGSSLGSLASLSLGPNRSLHLMRAGEDVVLVGVTEKAIVPVRTWSGDDAHKLLTELNAAPAPLTGPPSGLDLRAEALRAAESQPPSSTGARKSFLDELRSRTVRR